MVLTNPKKTYEGGTLSVGGRGYCCSGLREVSTQEEVLKLWGEPDKKWSQNGREKWLYYQEGLAWTMFMPIVVVPIPLGVPTGRNYATLEFDDQQIVSAVSKDRDGWYGMCGFFLMSAEPMLAPMCISK